VYTFCCPEEAKVKERMIAASFKSQALHWLEKSIGLDIIRKLEVSSVADVLSDDQLAKEIRESTGNKIDPASQSPLLTSTGFRKPKLPGRARP
jgi:hypothetical protein